MRSFDIAVVGLGAYGAATLMHLAKAGVKVVGIDQFSPPHEFGSSHGETRITRESIAEGGQYISCVRRSHELWRSIESEVGVDIFRQCGGLLIDGDSEGELHGVRGFAKNSIELAERYGIAHEVLSPREARQRFPGFQIEDEAVVYFEPGAGFLYPDVAIEAQLRIAKNCGATIIMQAPVSKLTRVTAGGVRIATAHGDIEVGACLLSAGAWVREFLPESLRPEFSITRQVFHWLPVQRGAYNLATSPVFVWCYSGGQVYGFPSLDGKTIKAASELFVGYESPNGIERAVREQEQTSFYQQIVGRLPAVHARPVQSKVCLYTMAPRGDFAIEYHPHIPELLIASCCSGHGFKHSAAIGESLAAILRGVEPMLSLDHFRKPEWCCLASLRPS